MRRKPSLFSVLTAFLLIVSAIAAPAVLAAKGGSSIRTECGSDAFNKFQISDGKDPLGPPAGTPLTPPDSSDPPGWVINLFFEDNPLTMDTWEYRYENTTLQDADPGNDWFIFRIVVKGGKGSTAQENPPQHGPIVAPTDTSHITFCLSRPADVHLQKAASPTTVDEGGTITYTLTFSNDGLGTAHQATITDDLPENTEFVSCSDGCTNPDGTPPDENTTTAKWEVGPIPAGGSGSVTLTVRVLQAPTECVICNVAQISSPQDVGPPESSNEACVTIVPVPHPEGATASGEATGLFVDLTTGVSTVDDLFPITISESESSQTGPGSSSDSDQFLAVDVPDETVPVPGFGDGEIVSADVFTTSSRSTVEGTQSTQTSTAEVLGLNILNGVVTSSTVRAVASTTASGEASSFSSAGSTFEDLLIDVDGPGGDDAELFTNVAPGTTIDLDTGTAPLFGAGSKIVLYEREGTTTDSGGTFAADLSVIMIHVTITDVVAVAGTQALEIRVSEAVAHSDFRRTHVCEPVPQQLVSGHAFIASEQTNPDLVPVLVGFVSIPVTGGEDHQHLEHIKVPNNGSVLTVDSAETDSCGHPETTDCSGNTASSFAEAAGVCVLKMAGICTLEATTIRSQSNSNPGSSAGETILVDVDVFGTDVCGTLQLESTCTPPANTVIPLDADGPDGLPGFGFIVLNEQVCDNGGTIENDCADGSVAGHNGLTVRAIHIVFTTAALGLPAGAEIILSEAHSDVTTGIL